MTVRRILVVEGEPHMRDFLAELLTAFGHRVESAANGNEALTLLTERTFALILTDLRMPEVDGEGLYQKIAHTWPHLASRMVFVTGDEPSPALAMFFGAQKVPILRKPFTHDEPRRLVEEMLSKEL